MKKKAFVTSRDASLVRFLDTHSNICMTANQIASLFYADESKSEESAYKIAMRRLKILADSRYLKRQRDYSNEPFIFYSNDSKKMKRSAHKSKMIDFLIHLKKAQIEVISVSFEYAELQLSHGLRPDMMVICDSFGQRFALFVEVDLTKEFNADAYRKVVRDSQHVRGIVGHTFGIVSVCDKRTDTDFSVINIKTDFSNFNNLVWSLNSAK